MAYASDAATATTAAAATAVLSQGLAQENSQPG